MSAEEFEFLDLVDFGGVAFSMESVIGCVLCIGVATRAHHP